MTREEAIKIIDCYDIGFYDLSGEKIPADKLADAFDMAIEALQGDMYCPNCGVRLVPESEYIEPTQSHGRLIDADALYASIAKDTYLLTDRINSRDYGMFLVGIKKKIDNAPTVQADRPHGEWVEKTRQDGDVLRYWHECSNCGKRPQYVYARTTHECICENLSDFCPNCGARMTPYKGGEDDNA